MPRQPKPDGITPRDAEVFAALDDLAKRLKNPPTQAILAKELGITPKCLRPHLARLQRHGKVAWEYGEAHTLAIAAPIRPDEVTNNGKPVSGRQN